MSGNPKIYLFHQVKIYDKSVQRDQNLTSFEDYQKPVSLSAKNASSCDQQCDPTN